MEPSLSHRLNHVSFQSMTNNGRVKDKEGRGLMYWGPLHATNQERPLVSFNDPGQPP